MRPAPLLNRSRQRGAALLALALLLISILLGAFFSAMNSGSVQPRAIGQRRIDRSA